MLQHCLVADLTQLLNLMSRGPGTPKMDQHGRQTFIEFGIKSDFVVFLPEHDYDINI